MGTSKDEKVNRRDFMKTAIIAIGGVIGGAIGLPAVPYIIGPAGQQEEGDWIRLGSINKIELNVPTLFKTTLETQTGWVSSEEEFAVYVLTENGQEFTVMSNICTHLGCRVRWVDEQEQFFCPCHNAAFEKNGDVAHGPPPKPLDQYEVKVEDDQIFILGG